MPRKPKHLRNSTGAEYRFKIDAYTPTTIPMARLAEYMRELSLMLGEPASVHFERLELGSTVLVHRVENEAIPKIRERVSGVKRGDAPREALRAYKTINKFLREDNAVGDYREKKTSAVIIQFPGRQEAEEKFPLVKQVGSIDGRVIRVGGNDDTVPVWLEAEGVQITGCYTSRGVAKQLGARLYDQVRLFGKGRWSRDGEGNWSLVDFKIENFEPLDDMPLSDALMALRGIPTEWTDEAYGEISLVRHGQKAKGNGGH